MAEDFYFAYNLQFNCVVIIQSLPAFERSTGKELYDDIIVRRCEQRGLPSYFREVNSRVQFFALMDALLDAVMNKNVVPIIHFEIHGSHSGFELANKETVQWEELTDYCRKINMLMRNKLLITLATCKGIGLYQIIDPYKPAPFWGIIGPKYNIYNNEVLRDFSSFYDILLESHNLQEAIDSLNVYQDGFTYAIITGEMILTLLSELAEEQSRSFMNFEEMRRKFLME